MNSRYGHPETMGVLIVDAGPTSLVAAVHCAQLSIPHALVGVRAWTTQTSNAALLHASAVELVRELGLAVAARVRVRQARTRGAPRMYAD